VTDHDLAHRSVYAELGRIRSGSHAVACAVIRCAVEEGHASASILDRLEEKVGRAMWIPEYRPLWYSAGRRETDRHIAVERELRAWRARGFPRVDRQMVVGGGG